MGHSLVWRRKPVGRFCCLFAASFFVYLIYLSFSSALPLHTDALNKQDTNSKLQQDSTKHKPQQQQQQQQQLQQQQNAAAGVISPHSAPAHPSNNNNNNSSSSNNNSSSSSSNSSSSSKSDDVSTEERLMSIRAAAASLLQDASGSLAGVHAIKVVDKQTKQIKKDIERDVRDLQSTLQQEI